MATITGQSLVDAIQASTGVTLNPLLQATLAARLQQQLDSGTYSSLAAAVAIQGFSTEIKAVVDANGGSAAFSTHLTEVAAAIQDDTPVPEFVPEAGLTFVLTAGAAEINEAVANTFTVTASEPVAVDTEVTFQLALGTAQLDDFDAGSFNAAKVVILAGETTATYAYTAIGNDGTELSETYSVTATVGGVTVGTTTVTILDGSEVPGQTFMLTKGLDNIAGTSGNDTIIGSVDSVAANVELNTLSALDIINGGAGADTLKIATNDATAVPLANISNVEIIEVQGANAGGTTVNTTTLTGVTNLNVTKTAGVIAATAGATTDVSVAMKAAGAAVGVVGGNNVSVKLTDVAAAADAVTIGTGTAPKGDVVVEMTGKAATATATLSAVTTTGGKTVSVTQKATSDASAIATNKVAATITQGAVTVTGNADTTTVTVKQDASVNAVAAVDAVAAKATTEEVVFTAAKAGDVVTIDFGDGKLSFTANKDLTAAQVASAFANLASGAKQGNASAELGIYTDIVDSGSAGGVTNKWSSGAVQTVSETQSKVVFSSSEAAANLAASVVNVAGSTLTAGDQNRVAGVTGVDSKTGVMGVANGVVTIKDSAAVGTIKTITVDGYADGVGAVTSRIGGTVAGDDTTSLETLNLSNAQGAATMVVDDTADTLALNLEKVGSSVTSSLGAVTTTTAVLTMTAAPTTLNVKSTGANYVNLTASATETLNVTGTGLLDISATDLAALKSVKVSEAAGLKLNAGVDNTVTNVDTTGTTGTVTVSIRGDLATYAGGAGKDVVTVTNANTAIAKAIDLGAGDDTLTLTGGVIATPTVDIKGGEGTDTLVMAAAQAQALTANATFAGKIEGFEKLSLQQVAADGNVSVNLANMDNISYVISAGAAAGVGGTKETTTVTFQALESGQSLTVAGKTVTATQFLTATNVADAMTGSTVTGATVTGNFAGWAVVAGGASPAVNFEATTVGNVANLSTLISQTNSTAPTAPTATTVTQGNAGTLESAIVSFGSLAAGEAVTVGGRTVTATPTTTETYEVTITVDLRAGDTITLNGLVVTATGGDATAAQIITAFANGTTTDNAAVSGAYTADFTVSEAGGVLTYTSATPNADVTDMEVASTGGYPITDAVVTTQGSAGNLTAAQVATAVSTTGTSGSGWAADVASVTGYTLSTAGLNANQVQFTNTTVGNATDITVVSTGNQPTIVITQGTDAATEAATVTFTALTSGQSVNVAGRTVTATGGNLTAAQVEAAYLANASSGAAAVGGALNASWNVAQSGTAGDGVLAFTSTTASTNVADLSTLVTVTPATAPSTALTSSVVDGTAAVSANGLLTLTKLANNATLELTGAAFTTTVELNDATGTADSFNIVANAANGTNLGTVVVDKVETISIEAKDTDTTSVLVGSTITPNVSTNTLVLDADAAKTVNLTGAGNLTLTLSADSKAVTLIDGSSATGKLNVTTLAGDTAATTVKGGSAADTLVAQGANDVLLGGAGNDVLKVVGSIASAVTLTGGDGVDQFDVSGFTAANAGAAATITDFTKGETIKFVSNANANFASSKVVLIDQATFDNYVTEAAKAASAADNGSHGLAWFQFGGDTFIVQDIVGNSAFDNGVDIIVKITGAVDLSASSFNEVGQGTLLYI